MGDRPGTPNPFVVGTVIDVVRTLQTTTTVGAWLGATMFVPDASRHADLSPLEHAVVDGLDVLADVCLRPHDRLDRVDELVRADLARRVPPAGLTRLAGHTEDWAGFEHGRIQPHRVVSQRFAEHVDFYENRVAAQLVDRLNEHLTRRIRELNTLTDGLNDLDAYNRALTDAESWRRLNRVAGLIAQAMSDTTTVRLAIAETLRVLRITRLARAHHAGHLEAELKKIRRYRRGEPVLPARRVPLRTGLDPGHVEPAVRPLGRGLRRRSRRRRDDRPARPPRRGPDPGRRLVPHPRPPRTPREEPGQIDQADLTGGQSQTVQEGSVLTRR